MSNGRGEIDQIEQIAGRPLPRFYRWFLMRMGRAMGPLAYPDLEFDVETVLVSYAHELVNPAPTALLLAYNYDEVMPLHRFYDFEHPVRDDARVGGGLTRAITLQFETFREMIGWGAVLEWGVETRAQRCVGAFRDIGGDVLAHLNPVMKSLGFEAPMQTGRFCNVYYRADAAMVTETSIGSAPTYHVFHLGGSDQGRVRRILGEITSETSLELEMMEWRPPL